MLIQYISDIHLEFLSKIPKIKPMAKTLVLAGDIGYPFSGIYKQFLVEMNNKYNKVFLITGNHEFYNLGKNENKSYDDINNQIKYIIESNNLKNVSFLDNSYEDYDGYRFVGTTLWSKLYNDDNRINDMEMIKEFNYDIYNEMHKIDCEFIEEILEDTSKPIVMITHHLPSYTLIAEKYKKYEKYNQYFASHCEKYIKDPIKLWIYGHTHAENISEINGVKMVCNPKGYPSENIYNDINKVIELELK